MSQAQSFPPIIPNRPFRFHPACEDPEIYVALRVSSCSAKVRCISKQEHSEFIASTTGQLVSFDKPGTPFTIAPTAQVFYLQQEDK